MPTFTMRLPDELKEVLAAMALLTGSSEADLARIAVRDLIQNFATKNGPDSLEKVIAEQLAELQKSVLAIQNYLASAEPDPG